MQWLEVNSTLLFLQREGNNTGFHGTQSRACEKERKQGYKHLADREQMAGWKWVSAREMCSAVLAYVSSSLWPACFSKDFIKWSEKYIGKLWRQRKVKNGGWGRRFTDCAFLSFMSLICIISNLFTHPERYQNTTSTTTKNTTKKQTKKKNKNKHHLKFPILPAPWLSPPLALECKAENLRKHWAAGLWMGTELAWPQQDPNILLTLISGPSTWVFIVQPVSIISTTVLNSLFSKSNILPKCDASYAHVRPRLRLLFGLNQYFLRLRSCPLTLFVIYPWVTLL